MKTFFQLILLISAFSGSFAQKEPGLYCGEKEEREKLLANPQIKKIWDHANEKWSRQVKAGIKNYNTESVVTIPIVFHIIHNNGPENVSDARVFTALQHLNLAFSNSGYYDSTDGVDVKIQFCLATQSPDGKSTTGINRLRSALTNICDTCMPAMKSLIVWDPYQYINVWVVNSISSSKPIVGIATFPGFHGSEYDGVVVRQDYFGASYASDAVITHELGHYFGLFHTFEGGCSNADCTKAGDLVCDTPPDQSTAYLPCNTTSNSCPTDTQSGFNTDQNDLKEDYMDYGNLSCMKVFTQGQAERMNFMLRLFRKSLLSSIGCLPPCPINLMAGFTSNKTAYLIGETAQFTNTSANGEQYEWYINDQLYSTAANISYTFSSIGYYTVKLIVYNSANISCKKTATQSFTITCPVQSSFKPTDTILNPGSVIQFMNQSLGASNYEWLVNNQPVSTAQDFTYTFTKPGNFFITLRACNLQCCSEKKVRILVLDTSNVLCKQPTFITRYNLPTTYNKLAAAYDSSFFVHSDYNMIAQVDRQGNSIAVKKAGDETQLYSFVSKSDKSYYSLGFRQNQSRSKKYLVTHHNPDLSIAWCKSIFFSDTTWNFEPLNISILSDESILLSGIVSDSTSVILDGFLARFDKNLNLIWIKVFNKSDLTIINSVSEAGNNLLVTGFANFGNEQYFLMKLDKNNGNVIWTKIIYNDGIEVFSDLVVKEKNNQIYYWFNNIFGRLFCQVYDENGTLLSTKTISKSGNYYSAALTQDGSVIVGYSQSNDLENYYSSFHKFALDGQSIWSKKYALLFPERLISVAELKDQSFALLTSNNTIAKTDKNGDMNGCGSLDTVLNLTARAWKNYPYLNWQKISSIPLTIESDSIGLITQSITSTDICVYPFCSRLRINGADTLCYISDTTTYKIEKLPGCNKSISWKFDTDYMQVLKISDTTITIKSLKNGVTQLSAQLIEGCDTISVRKEITLLATPLSINLGPDKEICIGSTITLKAAPGFKTYRWQDGFLNEIYTADKPGNYFVTVTDYCGNILSDTIVVREASAISFSLPDKIVKCANDTISITAPSGFKNYYWSPNYGISTPVGQSVNINTKIDTVYTLVAEKSDGCLVTDTIHVTVSNNIPVNFTDTSVSVCKDQSLIKLKGADGFEKYFWSTGSHDKSITVTKPGNYQLSVWNKEGCHSTANILVKDDKECSNRIQFPNAFTPNKDGKNEVFRPVFTGSFLTYSFSIYDRFGNRVFYSNDPFKAWDGRHNGKQLPSSTYVWQCVYQFNGTGTKKEIAKGTVTIIH